MATIYLGYHNGRALRRMNEVAFLQPDGAAASGLRLSTVATWDPQDDSFLVLESPEHVAVLAAWAGMPAEALLAELAQREEFLERLQREGVRDLRAVQEAVFGYQQGITPEGRPPHPATGRSRGRPASRRRPSAPER